MDLVIKADHFGGKHMLMISDNPKGPPGVHLNRVTHPLTTVRFRKKPRGRWQVLYLAVSPQFLRLLVYRGTVWHLCPRRHKSWKWQPVPGSAPKITLPRSFHAAPRDL